MNEPPYYISTDPALLNLDVIARLVGSAYWATGRTRETIQASLNMSVCFGAYRAGDRGQVGFARVVSDWCTFSWVCDVVVDPDHRGRGIGKLLIQTVVDHPAVRNTKSMLGTRDAHGLYERFGYVRSEMMRRMPPESMKITPAIASDLEAALALVQACAARMRQEGIDQWDEIYPDREDLAADIAAGELYFARDGSVIQGMIVLNETQLEQFAEVDWLYREGRILVVHRLAVSPAAQRQGLASRLMDFAADYGRQCGFAAIRLDAFTKNPAAMALYAKCGYRQAGISEFRKGTFACFEKSLAEDAPNLARENRSPIRVAIEADWPSIVTIYNQAIAMRSAVGDLEAISIASRRDWLSSHLDPRYPIYVESIGDQIAGWCSISAYRPGRAALLHTVELSYFVDHRFRRRGVATRLISHACAEAKRRGVRTVFGILMEINAPSIALLKKLGFELWGHLPKVAEIDGRECGHLYLGRRI